MKRVRWVVGVFGAIALITGFILIIWFSAVFDVRTVKVTGLGPSSTQAVSEALTDLTGQPLSRVTKEPIEQAVRAVAPEAASVTLQRSWPHTLVISVRPRIAVLNVRTPAGGQWADAEGVVFGPMNRPKHNLPLLIIGARQSRVDGDRQLAVLEATTVLAALPPAARQRLDSISISRPDQITLRLSRGVSVLWGDLAETQRKATILQALLPQKAARYDLSVPSVPTTAGQEKRS